ncbi:TPA: hypothetical protein L5621_003539 [Pseudomonas aeruginosa]|nr:hypothetical protein [Pseudomonas aeruginosa]
MGTRSASLPTGYNAKSLAEQFDAKPAEVRALFSNTLDPAWATELREKMQSAGLPVSASVAKSVNPR